MKRFAAAILISVLSVSALVAPSAQASIPVICLAYDTGGPGDSSFNDAAQAGLKAAAKNMQFTLETTVTSGDAKDRIDRLTALVKKRLHHSDRSWYRICGYSQRTFTTVS